MKRGISGLIAVLFLFAAAFIVVANANANNNTSNTSNYTSLPNASLNISDTNLTENLTDNVTGNESFINESIGDANITSNLSSNITSNITGNITSAQNISQNISTNTSLLCTEAQCDIGCVICNDTKCHPQGFSCVESVVIDKFLPAILGIGSGQINIRLENKGVVDLFNLSAEISGDGIATTDKIMLDNLAAGDKDYVFVKINASKKGTIDVVMKLYVNGVLKEKKIEQITVTEENIIEAQQSNVTIEKLNELNMHYREIEEEYQNKKIGGYQVDMLYDKLKDTSAYIKNAKLSFFEGNYRDAESNIRLADEGIEAIKEELKSAKKIEKSFMDKFRSNILIIGSIAAALVSMFTAYGLVKSHINAKKIKEMHDKLQLKKLIEKTHEKKEKQEQRPVDKADEKAEKKQETTEQKHEEDKPL